MSEKAADQKSTSSKGQNTKVKSAISRAEGL